MEIVKDDQPSATVVTEFDPSKQYRWNPDTEFKLDGGEFATLLNSLRAFLSTENSQIVLLADKAAKALENQLKEAVEDGRAVEVTR
mgnify:CR=1 FL=1|jgi:hypothetical protein